MRNDADACMPTFIVVINTEYNIQFYSIMIERELQPLLRLGDPISLR